MTGRGRPRQFSLDEVVDAAVALIEEGGGDALSMNALAKRLGTGTATLYNYVGSRDELVDLVLGRVLAEQPPVPRTTDVEQWAEGVVGYLLALFRDGISHPAVLRLWNERPDLHLGTALRGEEELSSLEAVGFPPQRAAEVHRILSSQLLGHIGSAALVAARPEARVVPTGTRLGRAQRHLTRLGEERIYESALRAVVASLAAELHELRDRT